MIITTLLGKDLLRAIRGVFGMAMSFVAPLLITVIIAFAFGGFAGGDGAEPEIQVIEVAVANLDQGVPGFSAGNLLLQFMQSEGLSRLIHVQVTPGEAEALALVNAGKAASAVVIPPGFSQAVSGGQAQVEVEMVSDPTLNLGPAVARAVVTQFIDGFNGAAVARMTADKQAIAAAAALSPAQSAQVMQAYGAWLQSASAAGGSNSALLFQNLPARPGKENSAADRIFGLILAGQMVFFGFWTAANNTLSLLNENEEGTLARLFTTPVKRQVVLLSKFSMVALFMAIQITVLLVASRLILKIHWGSLPVILAASLGLIVSASGFGIFIISLLKNSRQSGAVLGGLLTVLGMLSGLFTVGFSQQPTVLTIGEQLTPQGWAMRLWKLVMSGAGLGDMVVPLLVCLAAGLVFFSLGYLRFNRRFS